MRETIIGNVVTGILAFVIVLVIYGAILGTYKYFGEQMIFALINGALLGVIIGKLKPSVWIAVMLGVLTCMCTSFIKLLLEGHRLPEDWAYIRLHIIGSYYLIPGLIVGGILGYHHKMSKDPFTGCPK